MPRFVQGLMFFGTVVLAWVMVNTYLYMRVVWAFDLKERSIIKAAFVCLALAYVVGRALDVFLGRTPAYLFLWPGMVWMGFVALAISCLVPLEVFVSLPAWVLKTNGLISPSLASLLARIAIFLALGGATGLSIYGVTRALAGPSLVETEVLVPGLPKALDGLRVVAASDLHVGGGPPEGLSDRIISLMDSADADLVLLVGDLSDQLVDAKTFNRLARIRSRHGVYAVAGNHEYYTGRQSTLRLMEASGIHLLSQAHAVIASGLVVAGIDDPSFLPDGKGSVPSAIDQALAGRPEGLPVILLSHQPLGARHAAQASVALMLCGHTHGGQIPPFHLISWLFYDALAGATNVGGMTLLVSRGAGFWGPPMRVFADPEVHLLVLRSDGGGPRE